MKYTQNYNLNLPDPSDKVDVESLNSNFVKLDTEVFNAKNSVKNLEENNELFEESITALKKQVLVGGSDTLVYRVDENTGKIDNLKKDVENLKSGGGDGGGIVPAVYIRKSDESGDWFIEKYNNGYSRCWGAFTVKNLAIDMSWNDKYYGVVFIDLPSELFTETPIFVQVTVNGNSDSQSVCNIARLGKTFVGLSIIRVDGEETKPTTINELTFYIEVRGSSMLG